MTLEWTDGAAMRVSCLSLVQGLTLSELAEVLQATGPHGELANDELDLEPPQVDGRWVHPVQIAERQDWLVVIEPLSQAGADSRLTAPLSRGGRSVSVYQSINRHMTFTYAERGVLRRRFDPLVPEDAQGEPMSEETGLTFGDPEVDAFEQAAELAERITGVPLPSEWVLQTPHPVYLAPDDQG